MKKIFKGLGSVALALSLSLASVASADLTVGALTIDSSAALNLGPTSATSIVLGGNMTFTPGTHPTRDTFIIGASGNNATLRVFSDNLTALAIQGLSSANDTPASAAVNGFSGIFTSTAYSPNGTDGNANGNGTVQTRFVVGSGSTGLDLDLSSPNAILVRATDIANINTAQAGVVKIQSLTGIEFHARSKSDLVSPNRLIVDRVNQGVDDANIGTNNTSDVNLTVNTGNLRLLSSNTTGAVSVNTLTTTQRDALTKVTGMIIWNSTTTDFEGWTGAAWVELDNE